MILDVGAGTGRDVSGSVGFGHEGVAVEPNSSMLREASVRHRDKGIRWVEDRLPALDVTLHDKDEMDVLGPIEKRALRAMLKLELDA